MNSASMLNARCSRPPCRNMYVTNVHGRAAADSGSNPNIAWKRGSTSTVFWHKKTSRFATSSRRTQGVMPNIRCGSIGGLSPAPTPRGASEPEETLAQLGKLDPRGPGGLGEKAHSRHAGQRIGLQAKDVALRAQAEVN